jgi:hypothetical protein
MRGSLEAIARGELPDGYRAPATGGAAGSAS